MKSTKTTGTHNSPAKIVDNGGSLSTPRDQYLLEAERIKNEIGDLDQIRMTLGLSQRRACQLLLVDPSAWTRWNKTGAPPHIYQALKWLIELQKLNPEVATPRNFASRIDLIQSSTQAKIKELEGQLGTIERIVAAGATITPSAAHSPNDYAIENAVLQIEERFERQIADLTATIEKLMQQKQKTAKTKVKVKAKARDKARDKAKPKSKNAKKKTKSKLSQSKNLRKPQKSKVSSLKNRPRKKK